MNLFFHEKAEISMEKSLEIYSPILRMCFYGRRKIFDKRWISLIIPKINVDKSRNDVAI